MAGIAAKTTSAEGAAGPLPLVSVNHISLVCRSVQDSMDFYEHVLGFFPIKRPGSFNFDGAWLFSYGMGIHLLQSPNPGAMPKKQEINPMDNHMSFQCESMQVVESKLVEMNIKFVKRTVEEGGISVDQLFFHDPDDFMIEICNCDNLPVEYLGSAGSACPLNCHSNASSTNAALQQQQISASCASAATISHQMLRVP
jgi:catechol 2,3-dioxygenase-like lactoylglutathione lyase family enzyme|uniref:VOC domain-containing protein n=1 Tax=Picea sitchensis TaxID=3332 RepID=A9P1X4_PICSI|nr:unknown [Picea sitchensis]